MQPRPTPAQLKDKLNELVTALHRNREEKAAVLSDVVSFTNRLLDKMNANESIPHPEPQLVGSRQQPQSEVFGSMPPEDLKKGHSGDKAHEDEEVRHHQKYTNLTNWFHCCQTLKQESNKEVRKRIVANQWQVLQILQSKKQTMTNLPICKIVDIRPHLEDSLYVKSVEGDKRYSSKGLKKGQSLGPTILEHLRKDHLRLVYLIDIARSLVLLSQLGVYHRDLKIDNMIKDKEANTFYLIDFDDALYLGTQQPSECFANLVEAVRERSSGSLAAFHLLFLPCNREIMGFKKLSQRGVGLSNIKVVHRELTNDMHEYYLRSFNDILRYVYRDNPKKQKEYRMQVDDMSQQEKRSALLDIIEKLQGEQSVMTSQEQKDKLESSPFKPL